MTGFAHEVQNSVNLAIAEIKKNDFDRKLFNLISNDLSGILNKSGLNSYSFDFCGRLLSEEFISFFSSLLIECKFIEERWDKRLLKDKLVEFLASQEDEGEYSKTLSILGFNDQMIEFLYKVKSKYENSFNQR